MYKVDFGNMSKLQIFELDRKALQVKRNDFVGSDKRNGNFAIMLYNNEYYYAHSRANIINEMVLKMMLFQNLEVINHIWQELK